MRALRFRYCKTGGARNVPAKVEPVEVDDSFQCPASFGPFFWFYRARRILIHSRPVKSSWKAYKQTLLILLLRLGREDPSPPGGARTALRALVSVYVNINQQTTILSPLSLHKQKIRYLPCLCFSYDIETRSLEGQWKNRRREIMNRRPKVDM